jgi:hypothetical protein
MQTLPTDANCLVYCLHLKAESRTRLRCCNSSCCWRLLRLLLLLLLRRMLPPSPLAAGSGCRFRRRGGGCSRGHGCTHGRRGRRTCRCSLRRRAARRLVGGKAGPHLRYVEAKRLQMLRNGAVPRVVDYSLLDIR